MFDLFSVFFQRKTMSRLVSDRPGVSYSLVWYIVSIAVMLVGTTVGTFFEQLVFFFLGWQDLFGALFSAGTNFFAGIIFAIPGLLGFCILAFAYFVFARLLGGRALDFPQFLSDFFVVAASAGVVMGLFSFIPFLRHLLNFFVALYAVFLYLKLFREYFAVSFAKAFVIWFVPTAVLAVIAGLVALLLFGISLFLPPA